MSTRDFVTGVVGVVLFGIVAAILFLAPYWMELLR